MYYICNREGWFLSAVNGKATVILLFKRLGADRLYFRRYAQADEVRLLLCPVEWCEVRGMSTETDPPDHNGTGG